MQGNTGERSRRAMKILLTGASGLIGSALKAHLQSRGDTIIPLSRSATATPGRPSWFPERRQIDLAGAVELDAVIHLAGENIGQRWSKAVKQRIRDSRVNGTRLLCEALVRRSRRPKTLIAASATGIYG